MNRSTQETILGRKAQPASYDSAFFDGKSVLVTGAFGSIGELLCPTLCHIGANVTATDIDTFDVRDAWYANHWCETVKPDLIFHLAAQKYAPEGESIPAATVDTNITGTANVLSAAGSAHVVLASTCKAVQPETVYGATKLVAERMVLNAGGTVVRLFNVVPAVGNVFEKWEQVSPHDPVPVTNCTRHFITKEEAVAALLAAATREPGRYSPDPGFPQWISSVAKRLGRETQQIPRRRGDRLHEPLYGEYETAYAGSDGLLRVVSYHDEKVRDIA